MGRGILFLFLAALSVTLVCGEAWARGSRSHFHGGHAFHHRSHARAVIVAPAIVWPGYRYGGVGVLPRAYPLVPPAPAVPSYRYYCEELDRYYPDAPECPSGFRVVGDSASLPSSPADGSVPDLPAEPQVEKNIN